MLKQIADASCHKFWVWNKPVDIEHPAYLVVKLESTEEWGDNPHFKYYCELLAVGPDWISDENLKRGLDCGISVEEFRNAPIHAQVEMLAEVGLSAHLWNKAGNNKNELVKEARKQAQLASVFFGFYMDRHQNAMGSTGWDWIRGNF